TGVGTTVWGGAVYTEASSGRCGVAATGMPVAVRVVSLSMLMTRSPSFVAEGGDGIQACRLACRPYAEHDADQQARDDRGSEGRRGECERPAGDARDKRGDAESEGDA